MSELIHEALKPKDGPLTDESATDSRLADSQTGVNEDSEHSSQPASESPDPVQCLQEVVSICGLTYNAGDIAVLREGKEMGRQAVFNVAGKWIVRIFELHDGFRQPATFVWRILKDLEQANAPSERIRYHGILPNTALHYTVTEFVDGAPLTVGLCSRPEVRQQIVSLYRVLRQINVPVTVSTVENYMRPRLELLDTRIRSLSADVSQRVGALSSLSDFCPFRMVVSHCDMAPENIIGRFEPSLSISVIDWEFSSYVPEFRVGAQFGTKNGREIWGEDFLDRIGYGPYSDELIWTENLCMIAEDYEPPDFETQVLLALEVR
ncbi:hypothetical protein B0H11DRAFT_2134933 [Mycena galericulata]|nr:hypothetical protein B0H11DRAFT_2134933 [Mycena galericulata]